MTKIFHALTGAPADAGLEERLRAQTTVEPLAGIRATDRELVFRHYLKRLYLPYAEIVWAYRQIEESHVSLGCCGGVLEEHRVVLKGRDGGAVALSFDRESDAARLLDFLHERNEACAIGFTRENRERFEGPEKTSSAQ